MSIVHNIRGMSCTYQPNTVAVEPAAGSEPEAARVAYPIAELVATGVESFKIAISLSEVASL
jgi:hypothetical protein